MEQQHTVGTVVQNVLSYVAENAVRFSFQLLGAACILFCSWLLTRFVVKLVQNSLADKKLDITVEKFILQTVRIAILAMGFLFALSAIGVQIAPLIAGLSVAGVGIGLALQGPLSNYAAGATLVFTKPFKVGDIIEVAGHQGEVHDIILPRTILLGIDGSKIVIPNKHIIGEVIKNFSEFRKLEINVGVSYESDVKKALAIIEHIIKTEKHIPNAELYKLGIKEFADSSISLQAFVWVPQSKYVDVKFGINNQILEQFRTQGISIPYPQRDVHIYQK
jgi:small conductance mechanosensitive channel